MGYILVIVSAVLGVVSQMMLKKSAKKRHASWWREYVNVWVIGGYGLMVVSLVINLLAIYMGVLAQEVSIIECINYLLIPMAAWICFGEKITKRKIIAIIIIMIGAVLFFCHPGGWWDVSLL
jgi:drug/metabolite transporter (DMT)-like permease